MRQSHREPPLPRHQATISRPLQLQRPPQRRLQVHCSPGRSPPLQPQRPRQLQPQRRTAQRQRRPAQASSHRTNKRGLIVRPTPSSGSIRDRTSITSLEPTTTARRRAGPTCARRMRRRPATARRRTNAIRSPFGSPSNMCNHFNLTKAAAAVLLAAVWTSGARADPARTTARALIADWKAGDREMAAVAEVIASACQAAATAVRHVVIAAPRSARCFSNGVEGGGRSWLR